MQGIYKCTIMHSASFETHAWMGISSIFLTLLGVSAEMLLAGEHFYRSTRAGPAGTEFKHAAKNR